MASPLVPSCCASAEEVGLGVWNAIHSCYGWCFNSSVCDPVYNEQVPGELHWNMHSSCCHSFVPSFCDLVVLFVAVFCDSWSPVCHWVVYCHLPQPAVSRNAHRPSKNSLISSWFITICYVTVTQTWSLTTCNRFLLNTLRTGAFKLFKCTFPGSKQFKSTFIMCFFKYL